MDCQQFERACAMENGWQMIKKDSKRAAFTAVQKSTRAASSSLVRK